VEGDQENKTGQKSSQPLRTSHGTSATSNVEKSHAFAKHLANVLQPHPSENEPEEQEALIQLLETAYQLEPPINSLKSIEDQEVINSLTHKKLAVTNSSLIKFIKNCLLLE
jgi:hypothetical protein